MSVFDQHGNSRPRLRIFYFLIAALVLTLIGGLFYRQIIERHYHAAQEQEQNLRRVLIPGPRGNIFDRDDRLLVGNQPRHSAVIYLAELRAEFRRKYLTLFREYRDAGINPHGQPLEIKARAAVTQRYLDTLNKVTGRSEQIDSRNLDQHFHQRRLLPYPLMNDLSPDEVARIIEQIPVNSRIQIASSSVRRYPFGAAAGHALGFVSTTIDLPETTLPGDNLMTFPIPGSIGRSGIERAFNDRLQGRTGGEIWIVDPSGFRYGEPVKQLAQVQGYDITLSIDIDVQLVAERELGTRIGAVVAIDVATGEILALASRPGYDLSELTPFIPRKVFQRIEEEGGWLNRATHGLYPPGSTFKLITALAALRDGRITPDSVSYCGGRYRVGNRYFPCHARAGHGYINLVDALRVSCNVYFYEYGLLTGIESIAREARLFGLHETTAMELAEESRPVPDPDWKRRVRNEPWFPGDTANVSIGQGDLRVTPLQMAVFTASLARGKTRTNVTILNRGGSIPPLGGENIGLSATHLQAIFDGMERATETGTARFARVPGVRTAGKTGTSQVRVRNGTLNLAWFVGFAPVENPRVAISVLVEGASIDDDIAGGAVAAPIAREVVRSALEKLRILPLDPALSAAARS